VAGVVVVLLVIGALVALVLGQTDNTKATTTAAPTQTASQVLLATADRYFDRASGKPHELHNGTLDMTFEDATLTESRDTLASMMGDLGFQPSATA
jgi:hypothetical protein